MMRTALKAVLWPAVIAAAVIGVEWWIFR